MAWTIPRTWASGEVVTAANLNTHVRDNLLTISGAWTAFTTTWSGTIGNGSKSAVYSRVGRVISYRIVIVWGSTTSHAAANQTFTLPIATTQYPANAPVGYATCVDTSAGIMAGNGFAVISGGSTFAINMAGSVGAFWSNTVPMTWAANDSLYIVGSYECDTD